MSEKVLVLAVHMDGAPGREQDLHDQLAALLEPSRQEPGCLAYELQRDPDHPEKLFFYEKFRDQAALDLHLDTAHFRKFAAYRKAGSDPIAQVNVTRWAAMGQPLTLLFKLDLTPYHVTEADSSREGDLFAARLNLLAAQ